jgi:hypothetical protein
MKYFVISASDILSIKELILKMEIISQYDIKHIMALR